jgi:cytoskeletal protein CcmA (bactofilin family)/DNA-directed RNA polymerase subunit RPC12/RpoP
MGRYEICSVPLSSFLIHPSSFPFVPAKQSRKVPVACPHCGHTQEESPSAYSTTCKQCGKHYRVQDVLKPAAKPKQRAKDTIEVTCPQCGNKQNEPKSAYSSVCKKCQHHFRIEEILRPATKEPERPKDTRRVHCFKCGTELEVPPKAKSTMCKRCSSSVDLDDYRIDFSVTKNFKTKGRFVVEPKGFVFNTDSIVGEAVIKGKLHGKLVAEKSLEIYSSADFKGSFKAAKFVIPAGERFRWDQEIVVDSAEISGELVANLRAQETVSLKSTSRMFGDIAAKNLVVESGAVFVGKAKIGTPCS